MIVGLDYKTNDKLNTNGQQIVSVLSYFCLKLVTANKKNICHLSSSV